jgi:hypothetical protein
VLAEQARRLGFGSRFGRAAAERHAVGLRLEIVELLLQRGLGFVDGRVDADRLPSRVMTSLVPFLANWASCSSFFLRKSSKVLPRSSTAFFSSAGRVSVSLRSGARASGLRQEECSGITDEHGCCAFA